MGGGPDKRQTAAADRQTDISQEQLKLGKQQYADQKARLDAATPFYSGMMKNGLPYLPAALDYSGGITARAFSPARAALIKSFGVNRALPSGFRTQVMNDLNAEQARSYDANLIDFLNQNQAAKERGAAGTIGEAQIYNPQSYYQGASADNSSIMNAPLQKPGFAGTFGALIGAGAKLGSAAIKRA